MWKDQKKRLVGMVFLICPNLGGSFLISPPSCSAPALIHHGSGARRRSCSCLLATPDNKQGEDEKKNKFLEFLFNPYESKIPRELEAEIYKAEGNTAAAQERTQRVVKYGVVAFVLVGCAFFNGFLTELRHGPVMEENPALTLQDLGFGWVSSNFLFSFLFLNKIGGGLALISGAASGMLAEAELDSRRKNAERIWEELERRRNNASSSSSTKSKQRVITKKRKKSGKQQKRLGALSEVVMEEKQAPEQPSSEPVATDAEKKQDVEENEGIMGKLKGWYEKADSMAASQALLLNKELEDKGVLEKITDESGLKVVGKEAAAKLKEEQQEDAKPAKDEKQ